MFAAVAGGTVVAVTEPVTIPLLRRAAVIDVPVERSSHTVPTPRGGGAPVAVGLLVAAALIGGATAAVFAMAVATFGALGLVEDLCGVPAGRRLALQVIGSAVVALVPVSGVTAPLAVLLLLVLVTAGWITGFVNVFNFMDGVNGISAGHALVAGLGFAGLGWWLTDWFLIPAGAAVAASALAFMPWNLGQARVFLGDVGSYALGAALALMAADAMLKGVPAEATLGPLALYLADTGWTLLRRIRAGERWLEPHRTHVYQRWCDAGWSHQRVMLVTVSITAVLSLLGAVSLTGHPAVRAAADLAGAAVLLAYLHSPTLLARRVMPAAAR